MKNFREIHHIAEEIMADNFQQRAATPIESLMGQYVPRPQLGQIFEVSFEPGIYQIEEAASLDNFPRPMQIESDEILVLRSEYADKIQKAIRDFREDKARYERNGFLHKAGILIYGPPGSGKSKILQCEAQSLAEQGEVVFVAAESMYGLKNAMQNFRGVHPGRYLTVILEDVDKMIRWGGEKRLLEMVDGFETIGNVLFIGTTNHMEHLSEALKRKGRFGTHIEVPFPKYEARLDYLRQKLGRKVHDVKIKRLAEMTDGLGLGHLREMVISIFRNREPVRATIKQLREGIEKQIKEGESNSDEVSLYA